jgi:putative membrane protein
MTTKRKSFLGNFIFRWFVSALGLFIAAGLLGDSLEVDNSLGVLVVAGFILAAVNTLVKPVIVFLSLPALLISLGLFMIVINGLMVMIASKLYDPLMVTNFWAAMLAGMVIGLVNYLVVTITENR